MAYLDDLRYELKYTEKRLKGCDGGARKVIEKHIGQIKKDIEREEQRVGTTKNL